MRSRDAASYPLVHPIIHRLVPELGILRLEHPVAFVGEVQHLRSHTLPLQGGEQVKSLRDIQPVIELSVDHQHRRFEIRRAQVRRPLPVQLAVRVRHALELPFVEPQLFGRAPGRLGVEDAVVRHNALETAGVAEDARTRGPYL